jgi:hypothetical protein
VVEDVRGDKASMNRPLAVLAIGPMGMVACGSREFVSGGVEEGRAVHRAKRLASACE